MTNAIWPIIISWGQGKLPTPAQHEQLVQWLLASDGAAVWQSEDFSATAMIRRRIELLQSAIPQLEAGAMPLPGHWTDWIEPMWTLWLPLALRIDQAQRAKVLGAGYGKTGCGQVKDDKTCLFVQGILGGQGTGKTTLSKILQRLLEALGQRAAVLSIDDLYLTYAERCELSRQDPRFIWRGPPGTHDIALGIRTFDQIGQAASAAPLELPRFDKSLQGGQGDRTLPSLVTAPTIVLFEGWCVGTQPLDDGAFAELATLPEPIDTEADRLFARDCNAQLRRYLPLWDYLDGLIVLQPEDYRLSRQWRQQAEKEMINQGKSGLSDSEIAAFVTYFWRALHPQLFIDPLTHSDRTDLVITIGADHQATKLALPSSGGILKAV